MVQDQLVDYISSQMKAGVTRDAIKSALVSTGWLTADVEDTMKKVEGSSPAASAQPMAKPVSMGTGMGSATAAAKPASAGMGMGSSQPLRVSDLVSSSSATATKPAARIDPAAFGGKIVGNSFQSTTMTAAGKTAAPAMAAGGGQKKGMMGMIMWIVAGIVILGLGGLSWYFYSQQAGLSAQVATLSSQSTSVNSQLTDLQTQSTAAAAAAAAQLASLTAENADLSLNLSFFVAPAAGANSTQVTLMGLLSGGGKAPYIVTTDQNAKVYIANSTTASIASQLKPLMGQTVQVSGTYVPGSDEITIATVTGTGASSTPSTATSTTGS